MGKPKTKYHILENEQQLDMLIDACKKTGYASVDFETTWVIEYIIMIFILQF